MTQGPPVTVEGGPATSAPEPPSRPTGPLLLAGGVVAVAVLVLAEVLSPAAPRPDPVQASLELAPRDVAASRSGVLVLPVEVDNRGPAVRVLDAEVEASPVGQASATSGRTRVEAGGSGRVNALVQPDCAELGTAPMQVVLRLRLRTADGVEQPYELDLGEHPAVRQQVAGVCSVG